MFDLYQSDKANRCRYLLGKQGDNVLTVVGVNPSTATREKSDPTATRVENVARNNGFDGFAIVNLYPRRATNPDDLPLRKNTATFNKNVSSIEALIASQKRPSVWVAWGGDINRRQYLKQAFFVINDVLKKYKAYCLHYGELRKDGHPRHPSRLAYSWQFSRFDTDAYAQQLLSR